MSADIIQAKYDELDAIAQKFGGQADIAQDMQQRILSHFEALEDGGWIGRGSSAFFGEMRNDIFPALERLQLALSEARAVTLEASRLFRQAEQEAAQSFREQHGPPQQGNNGGGGSIGAGDSGGVSIGGVSIGGGGSGVSNYQKSGFNIGWQDSPIFEGDIEWANGKTTSQLGFRYGFEGEVGSESRTGSTSFGELEATGTASVKIGEFSGGVQVGIGDKGLPTAGIGAEATLASASAEGVIGDENLGLTGEVGVKGLTGEAFVGLKDGSFDASAGVSLITARGEVGTNIAGVNVGLTGEVGLKAEIGIQIGPRVEVKMPFFSFGFSIGRAKDGR